MERIPRESRFVCRVTGAGGSSRYWVICWNSHLFLGKAFLGFPRDLAWAGCWWHLLSFGTQQREETLPAHWLWCQSRTSSANAVLLSVETISYPFVWLCVDLVPISPKNMQVLSAKLPVCSQFCRIFLFSLIFFFLPFLWAFVFSFLLLTFLVFIWFTFVNFKTLKLCFGLYSSDSLLSQVRSCSKQVCYHRRVDVSVVYIHLGVTVWLSKTNT